ncbi:MAG TPA: hypothetical protein VGE62_03210 [Candidatus Paceibacterota bacterium]
MNIPRTIAMLLAFMAAMASAQEERTRATADQVTSQNFRIHTDHGIPGVPIASIKLTGLRKGSSARGIALTFSPHTSAWPNRLIVTAGSTTIASLEMPDEHLFDFEIPVQYIGDTGSESVLNVLASFPSSTKNGSMIDVRPSYVSIAEDSGTGTENERRLIVTKSKSTQHRFWKFGTANWSLSSAKTTHVYGQTGKASVVAEFELVVTANGDIEMPGNSSFEVLAMNNGSETPCTYTVQPDQNVSIIRSGTSAVLTVSAFLPEMRVLQYRNTSFRISKIKWKLAGRQEEVMQTWGLESLVAPKLSSSVSSK